VRTRIIIRGLGWKRLGRLRKWILTLRVCLWIVFLPPSDLKKDDDEEEEIECGLAANNEKLPMKIRSASLRISSSKVLAIVEEEDESEVTEET
jgi:hypothetical protein